MTLTDIIIRTFKPKDKPIKASDGGGLFLWIMPNGGKWWRLHYRFEKKQKLLSLGVYPDVSLKDARERRDEARKQLAAGIDPGENRKAVKAAKAERGANTFEVIAREWIQKQASLWTETNKSKVTKRLEKNVFPWLGKQPIEDITAPELLKVIERIENRGVIDTAHRALQTCGQIFRYAVASGRAKFDPTPNLHGALTPVRKKHYASITDPKKVGELMRAIKDYQGDLVVRYALRLAPLVFVRPGELRNAKWAEIDFEKAVWLIPAERMKMKANGDHIVPLSRQAIEILTELKAITGKRELVFPGTLTSKRAISDNTINSALRRMGYTRQEMTGHGFRAMARTILDEVLHVRPDYIEHQLAHAVRDPNGRAYNRTAHLPERKKMMQDWADYLERLAANATSDNNSKVA